MGDLQRQCLAFAYSGEGTEVEHHRLAGRTQIEKNDGQKGVESILKLEEHKTEPKVSGEGSPEERGGACAWHWETEG